MILNIKIAVTIYNEFPQTPFQTFPRMKIHLFFGLFVTVTTMSARLSVGNINKEWNVIGFILYKFRRMNLVCQVDPFFIFLYRFRILMEKICFRKCLAIHFGKFLSIFLNHFYLFLIYVYYMYIQNFGTNSRKLWMPNT